MARAHNRIAVVTGAGSGIGRATAGLMVRDGWRVVFAGRRLEALRQSIAMCEDPFGDIDARAIAVPTDVTRPDSVAALFDFVRARFARLDFLFNNAGVFTPGVPLEELRIEQWRAALDGQQRLAELWADVQSRARSTRAGTLVHQDLTLAERVLRDFSSENTRRVLVDSVEAHKAMLDFALRYAPTVTDHIQLHEGMRPLFDMYGVEQEIERALHRRVDLKSGGYLIIDQTEALTTIDVNTGGFVGVRSFDDTIFKTNLEAAQTIARQLRLRNLGGIIIIDFIDMDLPEHRAAVLDALNTAIATDRTRLTVNGFTHLGLVEMTRKRTRESLAHILCEPCPTCNGRGEIKTAQTVCYEILREVMREAKQFNPREFRILASQSVIDLLLDDESATLAHLSDDIGKPISLQVDAGYSQEQYDIVLL
jgi:ribonuclease G